jgi:CHAD domain-containing protein
VSELEMVAPPGARLARVAATLGARLGAEERREREAELIFYDTFDGRLRRAGLVLAHVRDSGDRGSDGRLVLCAAPAGQLLAGDRAPGVDGPSTVVPGPPPSAPFSARELPAGALRDRLAGVVEVRALLELASVHARILELSVRDSLGKLIARGELLQWSRAGAPVGCGAPVRLHLRALRGYERELDALRERLAGLALRAASEPLADEAARAAGRPPEGVDSGVSVALAASQRSDVAAVAVLRRLAEVMEANRQGAIEAIDPEFLHDFRVALRRTRTVLKQLRGVFAPPALAHFREEFRWLARATGPARDAEVQLLEWDALAALVGERWRADLEPVGAVLRRRRELEVRACGRALGGERARRLAQEWGELLDGLLAADDEQRPDAARPIGELAQERIGRAYERMRRRGALITDDSPAADYHELRKLGKELRYLFELFGRPLFGARAVRHPVAVLKELQDVLGRHQDREVQAALLRAIAGELARAPGGPEALMACGVLIERLRDDQLAARKEFAGCFARFADRRTRAAIRGLLS